MNKITIKDFEVPNKCGDCGFIGRYENGPFSKNPHCCCELIYALKKEDYRVNKNLLDKNCPLKVIQKLVKQEE